ncbi:MAG: hypothetical protein KAS90_03710 [Candidatus Aenigmarchaeota archaeon]|nr:hypothetical protein [Candidatus Aenigmarchaeota archaeon]
MDDDIKKLNPSVNYDAPPIKKNINIMLDESRSKREEYSSDIGIKNNNDETFFKYFTFILTIIFIIIILNITVASYKMIDPDLFSPCRNVLSDEIIDVYSSVDNQETARAALIQRVPGEYSFVESKIESCGIYGTFSYHFTDGNTTYIVCDDETVTHTDMVCKKQRVTQRFFISIITII